MNTNLDLFEGSGNLQLLLLLSFKFQQKKFLKCSQIKLNKILKIVLSRHIYTYKIRFPQFVILGDIYELKLSKFMLQFQNKKITEILYEYFVKGINYQTQF